MTNILAVDASLTSTGICMSDMLPFRLIPPKGVMGMPRLRWFKGEIHRLLQLHDIDLMIIEGYAFGAKGRVFTIGELGGVVKLVAWELGIDIMVTPPSTLKKFTTGLGNANKEAMLKAVHDNWGYLTFQNDEADAYALYKFAERSQDRKWKRTTQGLSLVGKCEYIIAEGSCN